MGPIVFADDVREEDALVAELDRLMRELRQVGHELDRIEAQVRRAANDAARERYEEYR
jgi:hypothetical protein